MARNETMTDWIFNRDTIGCFRFVRCGFDAHTGVARLVYAFDDGPELTETITLPGAPFVLDAARHAAAEQALRLLHLIAGVSYYKAAVPDEIRIDDYAIDADTATLFGFLPHSPLPSGEGQGVRVRSPMRYQWFPNPQPNPAPEGRGALPPHSTCDHTRLSPLVAARTRWSALRLCVPKVSRRR